MLILEPRTSDDETPESEASIGTADSTENICTPGASADSSGLCPSFSTLSFQIYCGLSWLICRGSPSAEFSSYQPRKSDTKCRRALRRHPDSQDSADSASTVSSSYIPSSSFTSSTASASPTPHYRFRSSSSGPLLTSCSLGAPLAEADGTQRGGKTRHRLRLSRSSPRDPSGGHRRDSDFSSGPQQLVLYGSNEFMV